MFTEPIESAAAISRWTDLGVTLPKDLVKAIEVYEAVRYTEIGYAPQFDIEKVTPKNAEAQIYELAEQISVREQNGGWAPLEAAKNRAMSAAAGQVNRAARLATPAIAGALLPEFDDHTDAYAAAVNELPDDLSAETLLAAGPEAVTAYQSAKAEAAELDRISLWVASAHYAFTGTNTGQESVIRVLQPVDTLQLLQLEQASKRQVDAVLAAINPVYYEAVKRGVPFGINTPHESRDIREELAPARRMINF
jgi:hypothetical protein